MNKIRTYTELLKLKTFEERFEYLKLNGVVGRETFGFDRYLNQTFYRSAEWKKIRDFVILRDNGRDLGAEDHEIYGKILVHHMNPIQVKSMSEIKALLNPDQLISVSHQTHNAIHYSNADILPKAPVKRTPNDTIPWKMNKN